MISNVKDDAVKTFYMGFHDAPNYGDTPRFKYEQEPIKVELSHTQAIMVVRELNLAFKGILEANKTLLKRQPDANNGVWP